MKPINVNSDVKLIEHIFHKLINLKEDCSKKISNLEMSFNNELKAFESKRSTLIRERDNAMTKEGFVIEAVSIAKSEYNKVRVYIWVTFALAIGLIVLNFYNNGLNLSHYAKVLLSLIAITYFSGKNMGEHIESLSGIRNLSQCAKKPPFYYKWFGKQSLQDISNKLSNKYLTETKAKFDKLIYDAETELNVKSKQLKDAKELELKLLDDELKNTLNTSLNQVNSAMNRLGQVSQTCSSRNNLIDGNNKILTNQTVYSQLYYFSHFENLQIANSSYAFPKYFQFGNNMNIHFEKKSNDKGKIKDILRDIILRNLLGIKFSKLKLIMYDPIELGAFFSDYHQLSKEITGGFVYHTIDELNEILDSTLRHISMVVQKILTNKYETLDDFNEHNTELAEPYKLLVVNDFPKTFDDYQLGKIKQILASGPKCGVYTIIIGSISQLGLSPINSLNVALLNPILNEINVDEIIELINQGTTAAGTVMVDLNSILIDETNWWTNDSSRSIALPLGKKGKEIQSLIFDNKDDNQALMIGKPGSGKSNLLHIIILSAITKYGPSDLEIYLIDFKGGVEFMSYAEYNIPQLKTVALESDREFGLSVIDGVDKELMRRETLFRNSGVQNIEQYNEKNPNQKITRILFIVDEFQEFFKIEDDIKEQVSLKYDNIIRKGRAFGINSLFSSQTLDGHSIPRSTKELIDIRIALMCGDNDVRAIMDDKNLAAKDLSRPGEAIYNAENGKTNGNQRFQVVFAEKSDINQIIYKVANKSMSGYVAKDRFIFRGDILAKITKENHPSNNLENLKFKALRLWIGEPVSMDPDYFIDIKQVPSQNLIVVGNNQESAALYSSIIYSLKKQQNKINKLLILNPLTDVDDGYEDFNNSYGESPLMTFYKIPQLDQLFDELCDLIEQRKTLSKNDGNVICILNSINKIARLREDNLEGVFNRLYNILNEGPELGVFCILHCDSLISLKRTNLNSYLSLFNHRILYNMSQDGFYDIIGNNSIKSLKSNRLVYYTDELGKYQIVKPYELNNNN
jgi:S-DNA-T family DNA segregation ATPase FtsK/SpoIIIE